jgi:uncharacterized repeat protein (TIGR03803 family)
LFSPLYSFLGGSNGSNPAPVIVGPNSSLYGGAAGGLNDCNGNDCGLVFNLTPLPTACRNVMCGWMENPIYLGTDASVWPGVSVFDTAGNLYGTTAGGGTYGYGTVFKLTPSAGGWTESVLYSFTGGNNGYSPTQVLVGNDGNLYGTARGGVYGDGIVFQLTPSGSGWTESVLHSFHYGVDGNDPSYLLQDSSGNLYGIATQYEPGTIFMLVKSDGQWQFSEYYIQHAGGNFEILNNLTMDAAGNLYGTGFGGQGCRSGRCNASPDNQPAAFFSYIFKAWPGSNGWQNQDLVFFNYEVFPALGNLGFDTQGNLYGTTSGCGTYGAGTVWRYSP